MKYFEGLIEKKESLRKSVEMERLFRRIKKKKMEKSSANSINRGSADSRNGRKIPKIMYTNKVVGNCEKLEFKDHVSEIKLDITGKVKTKFTWKVNHSVT